MGFFYVRIGKKVISAQYGLREHNRGLADVSTTVAQGGKSAQETAGNKKQLSLHSPSERVSEERAPSVSRSPVTARDSGLQ